MSYNNREPQDEEFTTLDISPRENNLDDRSAFRQEPQPAKQNDLEDQSCTEPNSSGNFIYKPLPLRIILHIASVAIGYVVYVGIAYIAAVVLTFITKLPIISFFAQYPAGPEIYVLSGTYSASILAGLYTSRFISRLAGDRRDYGYIVLSAFLLLLFVLKAVEMLLSSGFSLDLLSMVVFGILLCGGFLYSALKGESL